MTATKPSIPRSDADALAGAIAEAARILSRHEDMQQLYGDCQALSFMNVMKERGHPLDTELMARILGRMRQADDVGVYPVDQLPPEE